MYIPNHFRNENPDLIKKFISDNGFAILVSDVDGRPWASHIPLLLEQREHGVDLLTGHLAKANKQWKGFDNDKEVMAIFSGAHAYISSSWYNHENVPTWNYEAVHVYGKIRFTDENTTKRQLGCLIDKYENNRKCPVSLETISAEFYNREVKGLVGFEIEITAIQAVSKLSQNRDEENLNRIIDGLKAEQHNDSLKMAKLFEQNRPDS